MEKLFIAGAASLFVFAGALLYFAEKPGKDVSSEGLETFDSEQEFINSIESTSSYSLAKPMTSLDTAAESSAGAGGSAKVRRSSDTNIQVSGVSEPDLLKNSGNRIYYSPESHYYGKGSNTSIFRTLPPENFSKTGEIPAQGRMFLTNNSVISLGETIKAFERTSKEMIWEKNMNSSVEAARRIDNEIYLVLRDTPERTNPCPVRPMESVIVPCTDVYHPESGKVDTTFSLVKMNTGGEVLEENSFAGSSSNTVVYMSNDSIYLTYTETVSETDMLLNFLDERAGQYLVGETVDRIEKIRSYNLSDSAMRIEIQRAMEAYFNSLSEDRREEARMELENAVGNYTADRKREIQTTEVAEFDRGLELVAEGEVPGKINGRYSLDEENGNLRVSTTVADTWSFDVETENDLYTLNSDLEIIGSVKGMGLNEQIYSTRYIGDKAYIVTFRRIDPFHVVDLSDPENPELKGKLKLPGFSSYLNPLQEDRILGVGEENGTVKAVIFDVEDDEPEVLDSKVLEDYNSKVSQNSRAFQIDRENKIFFLPASDHAYFFNYSEGLEKEAEIEMENVQRGAYVNQNFYIFNDYKAKAVKIGEWEVEKEVKFAEEDDVVPLPGPVRVD
jgi:uncharacterized secreted protein with C-terminal beta-propeller domain